MQNDNVKLDNELAVLAAFTLAYMVQNAPCKRAARKLAQKYGIVEIIKTTPLFGDTETLNYFDKAIANIQDKIEEYNALER